MVALPPGEFMMGSPDDDPYATDIEKPQHLVRIAYPLAVGRFPVTFEEYDHFCQATGRVPPDDEGWGRGRRPVIEVSWDDAKAYVAWLAGDSPAVPAAFGGGVGIRLPGRHDDPLLVG